MGKHTLTIALVALALVVPLAVSGQKAKPPVYATVTIEQEIKSGEADVLVGRDVQTYGPIDQALYIHGDLLPPLGSTGFPDAVAELRASGPDGAGFYGPYSGQIRVLNDRIDYWFDTVEGCVADNTAANLCPFRAIVVDGVPVYTKVGKTRVLTSIAFNEGRYLLDYRPCDPAVDPVNCYFKLLGCYDDRDCPGGAGYVYATVNVVFQ